MTPLYSPDLILTLDVRLLQKQSDGMYKGKAGDVVVKVEDSVQFKWTLPEFLEDAAQELANAGKVE